MHTKYTNGEIWKVAYPILISLIMEQLIGMTDTAFMGRVGEVELGASAIAGVYYLAIFMLGFGFSIGSQILIARRNGEGNFLQNDWLHLLPGDLLSIRHGTSHVHPVPTVLSLDIITFGGLPAHL